MHEEVEEGVAVENARERGDAVELRLTFLFLNFSGVLVTRKEVGG